MLWNLLTQLGNSKLGFRKNIENTAAVATTTTRTFCANCQASWGRLELKPNTSHHQKNRRRKGLYILPVI